MPVDAPPPPPPPPCEFNSGSLYIRRETAWHRIDAWPSVQAYHRMPGNDGSSWIPAVPSFRLVLPYRRTQAKKPRRTSAGNQHPSAQLELQLDLNVENPTTVAARQVGRGELRRRAFNQFRFTLPKAMARGVERFPSHHYGLLQLLQRDPDLVDVLAGTPTLAYGLAIKAMGDRENNPAGICELDLLRLSRLKQLELAELLGFPATKSAVKFLRRIDPRALHPEVMEQIRLRFVASPDLPRMVGHIDGDLTAGILGLLVDQQLSERCQPSLFKEVSADKRQIYRAVTASLLEDILTMEEALDRREQTTFRSIERVQEVHDIMAVAYTRANQHSLADTDLPRPPFPALPGRIEPLRSTKALEQEGSSQQHCVAVYAKRVTSGGWYIYRILAPERATLSLRRMADGHWAVDQLYCKANAPVAPITRRAVDSWLEAHGV